MSINALGVTTQLIMVWINTFYFLSSFEVGTSNIFQCTTRLSRILTSSYNKWRCINLYLKINAFLVLVMQVIQTYHLGLFLWHFKGCTNMLISNLYCNEFRTYIWEKCTWDLTHKQKIEIGVYSSLARYFEQQYCTV